MIRKAVGLWARQAVADWHQTQSDDAILIGELPLIGNRLIELVQKHDDDAESLLTSDDSYFVTPVPSVEVRRVIEEARAKSIANPSHHKEEKDAPPNVIEGLWLELHELGTKTLSIQLPNNDYNPDLYAQVYTSLLKHRHHAVLNINEIIKTENSVYDFEANQSLAATEDTAQRIIKEIETTYSTEDLHRSVENWYKL